MRPLQQDRVGAGMGDSACSGGNACHADGCGGGPTEPAGRHRESGLVLQLVVPQLQVCGARAGMVPTGCTTHRHSRAGHIGCQRWDKAACAHGMDWLPWQAATTHSVQLCQSARPVGGGGGEGSMQFGRGQGAGPGGGGGEEQGWRRRHTCGGVDAKTGWPFSLHTPHAGQFLSCLLTSHVHAACGMQPVACVRQSLPRFPHVAPTGTRAPALQAWEVARLNLAAEAAACGRPACTVARC